MKVSADSLLALISQNLAGFGSLKPELALLAFFLFIIILDLFKANWIKAALPYWALTGILISFIFQIINLANQHKTIFNGLLLTDGLATYAGLLFSIAGCLTVFLSLFNHKLKQNTAGRGEYYAFLLVLLVGLHILVKSVNLLMLFVALELVSIASYLLTISLKKQLGAIEAGLKYILYGALASGIMVYGMSFLFGLGGSLQFTEALFWQNLSLTGTPFFITVITLTFTGFLFKIGASPFHFWTPDVYAGAPMPIVAFFATAPKTAGLVVIIRFLTPAAAYLPKDLVLDFGILIGGISLLTLVTGNFTALLQTNIRRLLGYSSIAHAGFILAALVAFANNSVAPVLFYVSILLFMNYGIFLTIQVLEDKLAVRELAQLSGLGKYIPALGILSIIFLISLTGLPPTAGFTAKLFLFTNIWQNYAAGGQPILLVVLVAALIFTVLALFYYIRIPYFLFFKSNFSADKKIVIVKENIFLGLLALPLFVFILQPEWLLNFIQQVIFN